MKWMLVVIIGLTVCWWCEVDAARKKCTTDKECHELQREDWNDKKKHPAKPLKGKDKDFFDNMGKKRKGPKGGKGGPFHTMMATFGGIRKECRTLTDAERTKLHNAFKWLFTNRTDANSPVTLYQVFIGQHRSASAPDAHFGPCFPGFHREFLVRFTNALQLYDPSVELCYWDSSLDYPLPDASQSCLWTAEYWGNGNGAVTSGFAANQPTYLPDCYSQGTALTRDVGGNSYLFTPTKLSTIYAAASSFTKLMTPYTFNNFESAHGGVHAFVYGHMSIISCSPNDPAFWFHHCFIDYVWEKCRQIQTTTKETDYPNDSKVPANHHSNDPMLPFPNKTCIDGLSNSYIPRIYSYADSPSTCTTHANCGGKALWCNSGKCTAAVRLNGQMLTAWPKEACYITGCTTPKNLNTVCKCA